MFEKYVENYLKEHPKRGSYPLDVMVIAADLTKIVHAIPPSGSRFAPDKADVKNTFDYFCNHIAEKLMLEKE